MEVHRRWRHVATDRRRTAGRGAGPRPHRDRRLDLTALTSLRGRGRAARRRDLSQRRCGRALGSGQQRSATVGTRRRLQRDRGRSARSRPRDRGERRRLALAGRGLLVRDPARRPGRRRLSPRRVLARRPAHAAARGGSRRGDLAQRRCDLELVVQPTDRAALPREHRRRVPVPRLRRTAGERFGGHPVARPRRWRVAARLAPRGRGGVRLRRSRPATSGRRVRRQAQPLRCAERRRPERHAGPDPRSGHALGAHHARRVLAGRPGCALSGLRPRARHPRRGPSLARHQSRPHARRGTGAGLARSLHRTRSRTRPAPRRGVRDRALAQACAAPVGGHRRRPCARDARWRRALAGRDTAGAHAVEQGLRPRGVTHGHARGVRRDQRVPTRRPLAARLAYSRWRPHVA